MKSNELTQLDIIETKLDIIVQTIFSKELDYNDNTLIRLDTYAKMFNERRKELIKKYDAQKEIEDEK